MKQIFRTDNAPKPVGPYSQAVRTGNLVFVAGQGPTNPATGQRVSGDVQAETRQVLDNLKAILQAAGSSMAQVVKVNCYLADMNDFQAMNAVYAEYFAADPPARTTIQAARLPGDIRVEIDVIAEVD